MLTVDEQLDQALARVKSLEADTLARESLLSESSAKTELLQGQITDASANIERLESDLQAARRTNDSLAAHVAEIESRVTNLSARNAELEAQEAEIETRASRRAVEIVASTGTATPVAVTPKGDHHAEDLVARFKAISDPKEQTAFWRSLTAQQQASIISNNSTL